MRSGRSSVADGLFWACFVPYVAALVVWLLIGLTPALTSVVPALHEALHDRGGDALQAGADVVVALENRDEVAHDLTIVAADGAEAGVVLAGAPAAPGAVVVHRFRAPAAGSYRLLSDDGDGAVGEIRFTEDGASELRLEARDGRFEKPGRGRFATVAQRLADASHRAGHGARVVLESVFSALNLGLGVVLLARRPRDRTAQLLALAMVGTAATFNNQSHSVLNLGLIGEQFLFHELFHLASGLAYMYAVVVFPDGRLPPFLVGPARRPLRGLYALSTVLVTALVMGAASQSHPGQTFFTFLFGLLIPLAGFIAQSYRLARVADPVARQQSRLLRWALAPMLAAALVFLAATAAFGSRVQEVAPAVFPSLFAIIPAALVVGILRYRLWDIDVIISKTLLSLGMAGFIGAVYVAVVVLLGRVIGTTGPTAGLQVAATAIAAVAFEPVRERLQRFANRLVYGQRATPYEIMADFGQRLAGAVSIEEVLPRIARATGTGIGAAAAQVTVLLPGGGARTVSWPPAVEATSFPRTIPVAYRGERVGEIAVVPSPGEDLSAEEDELLSALAAQAGPAFHNVRLTVELQARLEEISAQAAQLRASRQRIVNAREELRRRVVGDIHDRVEVRLEDVAASLDEAEAALARDPASAVAQLDAISAMTSDALEALRDLARGIFPPLLADRGVLSALEAHAAKARLVLHLDARSLAGGRRFDPQAEASVYFCLVEALGHLEASSEPASVQISAHDGRLAFRVANPVGGPNGEAPGDGEDPGGAVLSDRPDVQGMRDRVEAVGGAMEVGSHHPLVVSGWVPAEPLVASGR